MDNARKVFVEVAAPDEFLRDLMAGGVFVPTRLDLELGEIFVLEARLKDVGRPLSLPVRVLGRRVPRGAQGILSAGVIVQLADPYHPTARLLADLAQGSVVDLVGRLRERLRIDCVASFASEEDLRTTLELILEGSDQAVVTLDHPAQPRDRLRLRVVGPTLPRAEVIEVEVRGVILRDNLRQVRVRPIDEASAQRIADVIARLRHAEGQRKA